MKQKDELLRTQYVDLDEIQQEFLKYAPAYARNEPVRHCPKLLNFIHKG